MRLEFAFWRYEIFIVARAVLSYLSFKTTVEFLKYHANRNIQHDPFNIKVFFINSQYSCKLIIYIRDLINVMNSI